MFDVVFFIHNKYNKNANFTGIFHEKQRTKILQINIAIYSTDLFQKKTSKSSNIHHQT